MIRVVLARVVGNRKSRGEEQGVRGRGRAGSRTDQSDQCGPPPRTRFEQNLEEEQRVSYAGEHAREGRRQARPACRSVPVAQRRDQLWLELGGQGGSQRR